MSEHERPLTHDWIWLAIETLARRNGLTPSALARLAGLDPTAFNRSKRFTAEGRPRWPSTESVSKILEATRTSLDEFASIGLADALEVSFDDSEEGDLPGIVTVGEVRGAEVAGWEPQLLLAPANDEPAGPRRFAVAVADGSLEPVYSRGNTLVISEAAPSRPGDRVMVKPQGMQVMPRLLVAMTPSDIDLEPLGGNGRKETVARRHIDWMARIVLVRQ